MNRFDFNALDPHDGLKVRRVDEDREVSLRLSLIGGGEAQRVIPNADVDESTVLAVWEEPDAAANGACDRLQSVLEAVARYATTGGDWNELQHAIDRMKKLSPAGFDYPGWHYTSGDSFFDTAVDRVVHQHIFSSDVGAGEETEAVCWVEDYFIEYKTLGQIVRELRENEENPRQVEPDDEVERPGGRLLQLPAPDDSEGP